VTAFLLAELRAWREQRMLKSSAGSAALLAIAALMGPLHPLMVAFAGMIAFLVLGWTDGNRYQPSLSARRLLLDFPRGPAEIAAGKALSALAIWAASAFLLSPLLAACAIAWGLPASVATACLGAWLATYLLATSLGFCSSILFEKSDGLFGFLLYGCWFVASFFVDWMKAANPIIQVERAFGLAQGRMPTLGIGAEALAAALLFAASALALSHKRKRRNDHD
jgi:hypothetical protein